MPAVPKHKTTSRRKKNRRALTFAAPALFHLVPCPECRSSGGNCAPGGPSDPPLVAVLTTETGWIHRERVDALARLLTDWWEADQSVLRAEVPDDFP